jgi:arginyl-tRNA synthetase
LGYLAGTIDELRRRGVIVERDGVVFFETPEAVALRREGDEGWVLVDAHGDPKYLGTDIAYHRLCLEERGFDVKLDIWGANTQYHLQQMRIALPVLGIDPSRFEVVIYQYVRFLHEGVLKRMGKRTGLYLLLEDVIDAVGKDVARWFFLQASPDRQLDFDFELAMQQSNENPVYYVQYAHARIRSVLAAWAEKDGGDVTTLAGADLSPLTSEPAQALMLVLARYPAMLTSAAQDFAPHDVTFYLRELAAAYHSYYDAERILVDDDAVKRARLALVAACAQVLHNGLNVLGVSAPAKM